MANPTIDGVDLDVFANTISQDPSDYRTFGDIKRLLGKWTKGTPVPIQLLINHVVTQYNVYGYDMPRMFFAHNEENALWPQCKAILSALAMMPGELKGVNDHDAIFSGQISIDETLYEAVKAKLNSKRKGTT